MKRHILVKTTGELRAKAGGRAGDGLYIRPKEHFVNDSAACLVPKSDRSAHDISAAARDRDEELIPEEHRAYQLVVGETALRVSEVRRSAKCQRAPVCGGNLCAACGEDDINMNIDCDGARDRRYRRSKRHARRKDIRLVGVLVSQVLRTACGQQCRGIARRHPTNLRPEALVRA